MPSEMNALASLYLEHNRLTSLEGVPASVLQKPAVSIHAQSNPLSMETILAIHALEHGARIEFDMVVHEDDEDRSVKSLETELKNWFPDMDTDPWTHHDETDKASLATLLKRLHRSAAFQGEERNDSMAELKDILDGMQEDPVFRAYGFTLAHGASADCSDNVQAIFDEMRMQLANPVTRKDGTLDTVIQFYVGREKAHLISEYVDTLRGGDPLESVMLLQHTLSADLALPIRFKAIKHTRAATVSNNLAGHKARALRFVNDHFDPERVISKMLEESPAVDFLKKTYEPTFTAHQLLWTDALEQAGLDPADKMDVAVHNPQLHAARRSAFGDGSRFKTLQQKAELALLKAVATHAMENSGMSELDRTRFEIGRLTADPDWCEYIARSDVQADVINKFNLGDSTRPRSVEAWTLDVLASAMGTH